MQHYRIILSIRGKIQSLQIINQASSLMSLYRNFIETFLIKKVKMLSINAENNFTDINLVA